MEKNTIEFVAEGQVLTSATGKIYVASNTVEYIEAVFHLGDNWSGFDSVRAVWYTLDRCVASVLAIDGDVGTCIVPHEVLRRARKVVVNLVGITTDGEEVTERLTTYPITAIDVNAYAHADGDNCAPITPSQFEQFVNAVREEVANIKDIDRAVLNADYTLTIYYSDGTTDTVGPIRGEQGPQGEPGPQGPPGEVDAETLIRILPTDSASGAIASFPDGSDLVPMQSLTVSIEPKQSGSGTPSPDNVRPISGWDEVEAVVCGGNVWDEEWESGDINVTVDGTNHNNANRIRTKYYIPVLPNMTYYFKNSYVNPIVAFYDADKNYVSKAENDGWKGVSNNTFTTPSWCYYIRAYWNSTTYNHDIGINYPSTDHDYHAYQGTSYTTTLPSTVYGGTLNVVTGELVVDRAMVTLDGTEAWTFLSSTGRFYFTLSGMASGTGMNGYADWLATVTSLSSYGILFGYNNSAVYLVGLLDHISEITDLASFKAYLGTHNLTIVYPLATPQTYQLTPQEIAVLLGSNNVWSDCGDTRVVYSADIQKYIDKKLQ